MKNPSNETGEASSQHYYLLVDARNIYEDKDAAIAAAKQLPGYDEHYVLCFRVPRGDDWHLDTIQVFTEQEVKVLTGESHQDDQNPCGEVEKTNGTPG